jgi:hypothetical protein
VYRHAKALLSSGTYRRQNELNFETKNETWFPTPGFAGPRRLPRFVPCVNVRAASASIIGHGLIGHGGTIAIEELSPKIPALDFDRIKVPVRNVDVVRARPSGRTFTGIRPADRMGDLVTAPVR